MPEQDLAHFGVKGMKWGVRRQRKRNKRRQRRAERYQKSVNKGIAREKTRISIAKKNISDLKGGDPIYTDAEIKEITRGGRSFANGMLVGAAAMTVIAIKAAP